ncbi:hypothetical protein SUGI_1105410 [Cryptomeria japonica]|nr:hypothetical protein SUGI_1105410 [Cryptomeria japonica]
MTWNRGMAVKDDSVPHGLKLMIDDYPFVVDQLEIRSAIETWVGDYLSIYYSDESVNSGTEPEAWWHQIRYVGHGDKKDEIGGTRWNPWQSFKYCKCQTYQL